MAKSMTVDQIERLMSQNSIDWHKTNDQAAKDRLHQTNTELAEQRDALIGGASSFDSGSGKWAMSRMGTGDAAYQAASLPGAEDYSPYVREIQSAKEAAALAALEQAYQQNVLDLNAAEAKIAPTYQTARNETAGAAAVSRRNFGEFAAASGLHSGALGQSELARGIALQGNLNGLNAAEAGAYSDLALKRAKLSSEYNSAIAAAKASGATELAQMLYAEKVRLDEAAQTTAYQQAGLDYQAFETNYKARRDAAADAEAAQNWEFKNEQWDYTKERDTVADQRYEEETKYKRQQDALELAYKRDQGAFDRAMKKWTALGYLDAASAKILGLPAGTRTSDQIYKTARIMHMK